MSPYRPVAGGGVRQNESLTGEKAANEQRLHRQPRANEKPAEEEGEIDDEQSGLTTEPFDEVAG